MENNLNAMQNIASEVSVDKKDTKQKRSTATSKVVDARQIFEELSQKDISKYLKVIENKTDKNGNNLKYLDWAGAYSIMVDYDPTFDFGFGKPEDHSTNLLNGLEEFPDKSYVVHTWANVKGIIKTMHLPVINSSSFALKQEGYQVITKNGSIKVPSINFSTDLNKAYWRCLVKNLALFGLGIQLYFGDDLPNPDKELMTINDEPIIPQLSEPINSVQDKNDDSTITLEQALNTVFVLNNKEYLGQRFASSTKPLQTLDILKEFAQLDNNQGEAARCILAEVGERNPALKNLWDIH